MKKKKRKYNPTNAYNPARQKYQIEKLGEMIEVHRKNVHAISRSHDIHISYLGNFAKHDIKNAIQSMDSILTTTPPNEFNEEKIESLSTYLQVIRGTMDNFSKLVPYSASGKFTLSTLMVAVDTLTRADMQKNDINLSLEFPKKTSVEIHLPFHGILQMLHNVILNSVKSLELVENRKMIINATIDDNCLTFLTKDNGIEIVPTDEGKIFEYGYSTTGGSGIGLFHARYLCDQFHGTINLFNEPIDGFTKTFKICLPIIQPNGKDNIDN